MLAQHLNTLNNTNNRELLAVAESHVEHTSMQSLVAVSGREGSYLTVTHTAEQMGGWGEDSQRTNSSSSSRQGRFPAAERALSTVPTRTHTDTITHRHTHTHTDADTQTHRHTHKRTYNYLRKHTHLYRHTNTYAHKHTHIYAHTHITHPLTHTHT